MWGVRHHHLLTMVMAHIVQHHVQHLGHIIGKGLQVFRFSDSLFSGDCLFHLKVEMGLFPR